MTPRGHPPIDVRPVVLEGEHVRLEPLSREHLDGIERAGSFEQIWRWMSLFPRAREDFERVIDEALRQREAGLRLAFAIIEKTSAEVVGSTSFVAISPRDRRLEIGSTWLTPRVQRTPVNTECKYLLLRHCFEDLGCLRVELKADARNTPSRNAILRIGAKEEGTLRKHQLQQDGVQRDSVYFSILDDEWPDVKRRLEEMLRR
ncbi:MAG: GNAT family protein [Dehalococcoidia bacterium]